MRIGRSLIGVLLAFMAITGTAWADDWRRCNNISFRSLEFTVPPCSRLIEQGALDDTELRLALRRRADALFYGSHFLRATEAELAERARLLTQALHDLDQAIALGPGGSAPADPPFWLGSLGKGRADVLFELARFAEAANAYGDVMQQAAEPDSSAQLGRALSLANLGRFDEALADMSKLVRSYPDEAEQWIFLRAEINERAGRSEAAIADYEAVLRRVPDHSGASQGRERLQAPSSNN